MKIGASLGVTGGGCRGGTGGPAVAVGALTKAGMPTAGIAVSGASISSGDASGHWQISGGYLTVSSAGDTADLSGGPYSLTLDDGSTLDITVSANTFTAGDGDLPTLGALGSATLDGKTIKAVAGADLMGTSPGDTYEFGLSHTFTTGLTIESEDPTDTSKAAYIRRISFRHDGPITFDGIVFRDSFVPLTDDDAARIIRFNFASTNTPELTIKRGHFYTDGADVSAYDGNVGRITGTGAAHTNGVLTDTVILTNSPDLSGTPGDGTYQLKISGVLHNIIGVDDGADTVTIDDTVNIASGSAVDYVIVKRPCVLTGADAAGMTNYPLVLLEDCLFEDLKNGWGIGTNNGGLRVKRCWFRDCFTDQLSTGSDGNIQYLDVTDCVFGIASAQNTTDLDPHSDSLQVNVNSHNTTPTATINIVGNRFHHIQSVKPIQRIFAGTTGITASPWYSIKHNILHSNQSNAMTLAYVDSNTEIKWNTILTDTDTPGTGSTPIISLTNEQGAATVEGNIVHSISATSATETNNYTFAGTTNTDIAAALTGTVFGGSDYTDLATWTAAMLPDATQQAAGRGAGTYYTFDNGSATAGSYSGLGDGLANEP